MNLDIHFKDEASPTLRRLGEGLGDGETLHATMAFGVETAIRGHLDSAGYLGRVNKLGGKSTGFWKNVSQSVASVAAADSATVSISHRGTALRYYGGIVKPVKQKALSVPVHPSAHGIYARQYPGTLAFIPAGRAFGPVRAQGGGKLVGFLVRGEAHTITRGPRKGQPGIRPVKDGETIYVLTTETTHAPDPNVLPTEAQLSAAAAEAGTAYLGSLVDPAT